MTKKSFSLVFSTSRSFLLPLLLLTSSLLAHEHGTRTAHEKNRDLAKLDNLVLLDHLSTETEDAAMFKKYFSLPAPLYCNLLNLVAHGGYDDLFGLYDTTAALAITRTTDENGTNHYEVIPGKEENTIATIQYVDASEAKHVLCPDTSRKFDVDTTLLTDGSSSLLIKLGATYTSPSGKGPTYSISQSASWSQPIAKEGDDADYYWIKSRTDTDNAQGLKYQHVTGEVWVSLPGVERSDTLLWHTKKNNSTGLVTEAKVNVVVPKKVKVEHPNLDTTRTWGEWWDQRTFSQKAAIPVIAIASVIPSLIFSRTVLPTAAEYLEKVKLSRSSLAANKQAYDSLFQTTRSSTPNTPVRELCNSIANTPEAQNLSSTQRTFNSIRVQYNRFAYCTVPAALFAASYSTYWIWEQGMHYVNSH